MKLPSGQKFEYGRSRTGRSWFRSDRIIQHVEGCDKSQFVKSAILKILMLCSTFLLYPTWRYMKNWNIMSLRVNKNTLFFKLIAFSLLQISTFFVVLWREHFSWRRLGDERECSIELSCFVIVTISQVTIKYILEFMVNSRNT